MNFKRTIVPDLRHRSAYETRLWMGKGDKIKEVLAKAKKKQ